MDPVRQALLDGRRPLPRLGAVLAGRSGSLPFVVVDHQGGEVEPFVVFLRDLMLTDMSPLTVRSHANDLSRWWRLLGVLNVAWVRATYAEVEADAGQTITIDYRRYARLYTAGDARHQRIHGWHNVRVHDEHTGHALNVTLAEDTTFWECSPAWLIAALADPPANRDRRHRPHPPLPRRQTHREPAARTVQPRQRHATRHAHDRSTGVSSIQLNASDAAELAEMLTFISDWLAGVDSPHLAASFHRFMGVNTYGLDDLCTDLARLTFLLGHDDGEQLFGRDTQ